MSTVATQQSFIEQPVCCTLPSTAGNAGTDTFAAVENHTWIKLGVSIILAGQSMAWGLAVNLSEIESFSSVYWALHGVLLLSSLIAIVLNGLDLFRDFARSITSARLGIEALFTLSLLGAFLGSIYATFTGSGDIYYEVIIVVLVIYTFGRKLGQISKSKAIAEAHKFRETFNTVTVCLPDGSIEKKPICEIRPGDEFRVTPGEAISCSGKIRSGEGFVKETPLTGEPLPVRKKPEDHLHAGTWSVDGSFQCVAEETQENRLIDQILGEVEKAISDSRSQRERQAERWIQYFVIAVTTITFLTAVVWYFLNGWDASVINSMAVLLIACPCALGLATPLAVWTGTWKLSQLGVTSRSTNFLDALTHTKHLFFDKTGTLTQPQLKLDRIELAPEVSISAPQVLNLCKLLETEVEHPIAYVFQAQPADQEFLNQCEVLQKKWIPGKGVEAKLTISGETNTWRLGSPDWVLKNEEDRSTPLHKKILVLSKEGKRVADIPLTETLREGVVELFRKLKRLGIQCTILSGDPSPQWAEIEGVRIRYGLQPSEKAKIVKMSATKEEFPIFVGDGINDLHAMTEGQASIAIQDGGSPLTTSNADAVVVSKNMEILVPSIKLARKTDQILQGNFKIAITYNCIGITLAAMGWLHPIASVLIMTASSLLVTFRAIQKSESILI